MGYIKSNPNAKVIAVDFDGTLSLAHYPNLGEPNLTLIHNLIQARQKGHKVILWTCREYDSYLQEAIDFCCSYGLEFDAINENIQDINFFSRKIVADIYIDDLCYNVNQLEGESIWD